MGFKTVRLMNRRSKKLKTLLNNWPHAAPNIPHSNYSMMSTVTAILLLKNRVGEISKTFIKSFKNAPHRDVRCRLLHFYSPKPILSTCIARYNQSNAIKTFYVLLPEVERLNSCYLPDKSPMMTFPMNFWQIILKLTHSLTWKSSLWTQFVSQRRKFWKRHFYLGICMPYVGLSKIRIVSKKNWIFIRDVSSLFFPGNF